MGFHSLSRYEWVEFHVITLLLLYVTTTNNNVLADVLSDSETLSKPRNNNKGVY